MQVDKHTTYLTDFPAYDSRMTLFSHRVFHPLSPDIFFSLNPYSFLIISISFYKIYYYRFSKLYKKIRITIITARYTTITAYAL